MFRQIVERHKVTDLNKRISSFNAYIALMSMEKHSSSKWNLNYSYIPDSSGAQPKNVANLFSLPLLISQNSDSHYENMSMQYTAIFHGSKNENLKINKLKFFLFLPKHRLWVHVRTASMRRF